ncbi:OVARIAN TUMOR DOMAIN-containing deubiquitinating enzyme 12-like [Aristolochia californica]|uniref:OVARIAN TUMOR DOMAIN-containing deubiquitinating enzyme 12-like n=1 Tax=Aristolochia californica TaxID=171875 RepID=UPI0035D5DAA9
MITYEQDPDVVRWGLNLLDGGDPFSNSAYCGTIVQHDSNYYDDEYVRECPFSSERPTIENDEILAHALQEEFSHLAVAEASGSSNVGEEHLQASILAQDWFGPSSRNYTAEHDGGQEEGDDVGSSSSCSSPGENPYGGVDWSASLELPDEFSALDGEVGKRLNQMVPVPHVPRINGEIPSVDEATTDHQRLLDRLQLYDLVELKIQGDGNCQFRALSDQFYRTTEHHKFVRQQVVIQLKAHPDIYEGYVPMAYGEYLKKMSMAGEWGDHVTLQAAADSYGVKIFVITSFKDTCYIEILPNIQKSKRVIFLSFWAEVHYNSIYPEGDMPVSEETKKKRRVNIVEQLPSYCKIM